MRRETRRPWAFAPRHVAGTDYALKVENAADGRPELFIYDHIDADADPQWGGVNASMVMAALPSTGADITVRINSPGGDVREGIAILSCLRLHAGHVRVQIDGLAASAASFIAMAGDEIVMMPNTEMMIHDASMITWGNAQDLRDDAAYLDRVSGNIADVYAMRTGTAAADWRARMLAETWYSAEEAVAAGLADSVMEIAESKSRAAAARIGNTWDLPFARYAGRRDAPDPIVASAPAPEPTPDPPITPYAAFVAALTHGEAVT